MNDLVEYKPLTPMTAVEVQQQVAVIKEIMTKIMIKDVHYGTIPGTKGNALFKPGSDTLLSAFHIAIDPEIEDLSTYQEIRYRVRCRGVSMGSGTLIGIGVGECSSNEEKYKWRKCGDQEYKRSPEDRRRMALKMIWNDQRRCKVETAVPQVRTEVADQANTVLKMAKKRAQVDLTLTALAAGDVFDQPGPPAPARNMSQDPQNNYPREPDFPPGFDNPPVNSTNGSDELNLGHVRAAIDKSGLRDIDLWAHVNVTHWNDITGDKLAAAMSWIEENSP